MKDKKYIKSFNEASESPSGLEKDIIDILNKNFKGQDIDKARKEFCELLKIKRSDSPKCPNCAADRKKQSSIGKWEDGEEFRCDDCDTEWEYDYFV